MRARQAAGDKFCNAQPPGFQRKVISFLCPRKETQVSVKADQKAQRTAEKTRPLGGSPGTSGQGLACGPENRKRKGVREGKEPKQSLVWNFCQCSPTTPALLQPKCLAWSLSREVQNLCTTPGHGEAFYSTSLISYVIAGLSRTSIHCICPQGSIQELIPSSLYSTYSSGVRAEAGDTHQHTQGCTEKEIGNLGLCSALPATKNTGGCSGLCF